MFHESILVASINFQDTNNENLLFYWSKL